MTCAYFSDAWWKTTSEDFLPKVNLTTSRSIHASEPTIFIGRRPKLKTRENTSTEKIHFNTFHRKPPDFRAPKTQGTHRHNSMTRIVHQCFHPYRWKPAECKVFDVNIISMEAPGFLGPETFWTLCERNSSETIRWRTWFETNASKENRKIVPNQKWEHNFQPAESRGFSQVFFSKLTWLPWVTKWPLVIFDALSHTGWGTNYTSASFHWVCILRAEGRFMRWWWWLLLLFPLFVRMAFGQIPFPRPSWKCG